MSKQKYTARVWFDVWGLEGDYETAEEALNEMLDKIGKVDTGSLSWDNVEWDIKEDEEGEN